MYRAPSTTPDTATTASTNGQACPAWYSGQAAVKAPSRTRNSPVKPLVVGRPTEASVSTMKKTEYTGSSLARPP